MAKGSGFLGAQAESLGQWLRSRMPAWLKTETVLLENWQWLGLLLIILIGVTLNRIVAFLLFSASDRSLRRKDMEVDAETLRNGVRPFGIMAMGAVWWLGVYLLDLPQGLLSIFVVAAKVVVVAAGVWGAYRLVNVFCAALAKRAKGTATRFDDVLIPLLRTSLKVFILAFGVVFVAANLDIDVSSLLAGLGLGGLAFALAAQDTVKNLFGSVTILIDRPFSIGDWIKTGDVEGTVEEVGLRSTRIRTFYNSLVTVPNSTMLAATIDNLGARKYRRWYTHISITYDTPAESIEAFCEGIRELIRTHPYTRKDYFHVYMHEFSSSSLDVLLYVFFETTDWSTELRERHRLFLDIVRLAQRLGVEFAFPTRTLYMRQETKSKRGGRMAAPKASEVDRAVDRGRKEARSIVEGVQGKSDGRPPPVKFDVPSREDRGEASPEGSDEGD